MRMEMWQAGLLFDGITVVSMSNSALLSHRSSLLTPLHRFINEEIQVIKHKKNRQQLSTLVKAFVPITFQPHV